MFAMIARSGRILRSVFLAGGRSSYECVRMMMRMCVLCMPVCSAADALVVAAGCCWNIRVHFAAAVFTRGANRCSFYFV